MTGAEVRVAAAGECRASPSSAARGEDPTRPPDHPRGEGSATHLQAKGDSPQGRMCERWEGDGKRGEGDRKRGEGDRERGGDSVRGGKYKGGTMRRGMEIDRLLAMKTKKVERIQREEWERE